MGLMEGNGGLSVADALALQDRGGNCNGNDIFGGNSTWVFFLFFLLAWGNGGLGGFGGNQQNAAISNSLNQQDLFRNQANIMQEIGAFERDATNNWGNMKYDNLLGVNSINQNLNNMQARQDACCCETNRNIDAVKYENAKNTCDIVTNNNYNTRDLTSEIHASTQRIIDHLTHNEMQRLRDEALVTEVTNKLRPCPVPAYPSCSPYQTFYQNGCGSGYGY